MGADKTHRAERTWAIVELRKYKHYLLKAPVIFSWKDEQRIRRQDVGLTHDLTMSGAFIFATRPPPLNTNLELEVYLPPTSAALPARIHGQGQVVRLESARGRRRAGFAVAAEPFVLRRARQYR